MKKTFKTDKISCSGCSNMIKASLEDTFGEISVNLDASPKEVTLEITDAKQEETFKSQMKELGFELIEE